MPVHYGSKALNFQTISSPLATQIPQAAGAGNDYTNTHSLSSLPLAVSLLCVIHSLIDVYVYLCHVHHP
jgi:hypothetical protein